MFNESLLWQAHAYIYRHFADSTHAPRVEDVASHIGIEVGQAAGLYRELHKRHAIFLEPETAGIRMAYPFSAVRTDFRVRSNGKTYYANSAWDMLGIPAVLHHDAIIEAICAGGDHVVKLQVISGQVSASDLRIHFTVPYARWYDDPLFSWRTILLFRSEEMINQWCKNNQLTRGEVLSVSETWKLSKLWYHNHMSEEYHGRTGEQAAAIFRQIGLTSSFWYE